MVTYIGEEPWGATSSWYLNNNANDVKGAFNGTGSGVTYALAKWSYYGEFDGTADRISIGNGPKNTSFTAMGWYYYTSGQTGTIVSTLTLATSKYYGFFLSCVTNRVKLLVASGTGTTEGTDFAQTNGISGSVTSSAWHHLVGTYNGSVLKVYVDGCLEGSTNFAGGCAYASTTLGMIGVRQDSSGTYNEYIKGNLDNVAIFPRAMSDGEIRRYYAWATGHLD